MLAALQTVLLLRGLRSTGPSELLCGVNLVATVASKKVSSTSNASSVLANNPCVHLPPSLTMLHLFCNATVCGHFLYLCAVHEQSVINILGIWEVKDGPKLPDSSLVRRNLTGNLPSSGYGVPGIPATIYLPIYRCIYKNK